MSFTYPLWVWILLVIAAIAALRLLSRRR